MSWKHVLGHDAAVASLTSAWKRGRLAHAYLFVGPAGVGKHTFARELAKAVLCEGRAGRFEACDECASCRLVDAGTHPDLFLTSRGDQLEFSIGAVRELLDNLALKPARGARKVGILDEADELNDVAANAFLKTLEEPPPGSLLILVGGMSTEGQLPTILSRCQVIRFAPLSAGLMKQVLAAHEVTEPARQERLLQLAGGSPGQALAVDDEEVWQFRKQLLDVFKGGKIDPAAVGRQWMEFVENAGKDAAAHRQRASLILRLVIALLESALKLTVSNSPTGIDADESQGLRQIGAALGEERLLAWIERALEADLQIDRRVQLVLVIEAFLDAISRGPASQAGRRI